MECLQSSVPEMQPRKVPLTAKSRVNGENPIRSNNRIAMTRLKRTDSEKISQRSLMTICQRPWAPNAHTNTNARFALLGFDYAIGFETP